jgi:AmiR/NasT family two-component response regulator
MSPRSLTSLIVFDNGQAAGLDGLALAVASFGYGRFELSYVDDLAAFRAVDGHLADRSVIVVNVDDDPQPKQTLADLADVGLPVVVLTDRRDGTIAEHARSVGAAACLPLSLPAREIISRLAVSTP